MFLGTASRFSYSQVELPIGCGGVTTYQILMNSEWAIIYWAVRALVLRSASERGTTQSIC
jgi:hypothetical protein